MGSHTESSQAAVAREDILLTNLEGMEAFALSPASKYTILRTAGQIMTDGKERLKFDGPDMHKSDETSVTAFRAPGSEFSRAAKGTVYYADMDPNDLGKSLSLDWADNSIKARMRAGNSPDQIRSWYLMRSFELFVEQMEIIGVSQSGGIGNATSPFDSTLCADYDATSTGSGSWDENTSDPRKDIRYIQDGLRNDVGINADVAYMSSTVRRALSCHPALVEMWGGNAGFGSLTDQQIAQSLGLREIYVGDPDLYGEYVTLATMGTPGGMVDANPNGYALIYAYDPESGTGPYGIQYTTEMIPGTANRGENCTAHAYCGFAVNPIGGRRISNVLA